MPEQREQQQYSDPADPNYEICGQRWGVDFFFVHGL
jgi:hypothetical protein